MLILFGDEVVGMQPDGPPGGGDVSSDILRHVCAGLEALGGQPHVPHDYQSFRRAVLEAQWAVRMQLKTRPASAAAALASPDCRAMRWLLAEVSAAAGGHGRGSPDLLRLECAADTDPSLLAALTAWPTPTPDMPALESLAKRLEVVADALLLVGRLLVAPFLAPLSQPAVERGTLTDERLDAGGQCPTCGAAPGIAMLRRSDGVRVLCCGLCGARWRFARLTCADCGTQDAQAFSRMRVGDDDPRWLEVCSACGAYLKVVDARRLPEGAQIWPLVEDVATLHLDLLAEREGWTRRPPYAALW